MRARRLLTEIKNPKTKPDNEDSAYVKGWNKWWNKGTGTPRKKSKEIRVVKEDLFGDESGDEWKNGDQEKQPLHLYPTDYAQKPSTHEPHEMERVYDQFTDGDLVDIANETVDRLAGLVDRGEVPNTELRFHVLNAIENLEKALGMVDDLA